MNVAVVVPCYRQERWLPRTAAALEHALVEVDFEAVLVRAAPGGEALPVLGPSWRVIEPPVVQPLTPGAARMLGLSATRAPWVLFCDADVEVDRHWMGAALACARRPDAPAGLGGRLEEWFQAGDAERAGQRDLYRVGETESSVRYLATLALYRRDALLEAGGYEPRLASEEDYELGLRLRRSGHRMLSLGQRAGRHFSDPRPSLAELKRRWRSGLCYGQGQILRLYWGRPGLGELALRQRLYVAVLVYWLLGLGALAVLGRNPAPFLTWLLLGAIGAFLLALRKHSPRLAFYSLLTWHVNAAGMVRGFIAGPARVGLPGAARASG